MKILVIMFVALFVSCSVAHAEDQNYAYIEFNLPVKLNANGWQGNFPSSTEIGYFWGNWKHLYTKAYINHQSNFERGRPFNNEPESYLDTAGITIGWRFW